jgi:hypothetical protein
MDIYTCEHCGLFHTSLLWLFIHISTNHQHCDKGLDLSGSETGERYCQELALAWSNFVTYRVEVKA